MNARNITAHCYTHARNITAAHYYTHACNITAHHYTK